MSRPRMGALRRDVSRFLLAHWFKFDPEPPVVKDAVVTQTAAPAPETSDDSASATNDLPLPPNFPAKLAQIVKLTRAGLREDVVLHMSRIPEKITRPRPTRWFSCISPASPKRSWPRWCNKKRSLRHLWLRCLLLPHPGDGFRGQTDCPGARQGSCRGATFATGFW